mgnify:CR=1 FL=1
MYEWGISENLYMYTLRDYIIQFILQHIYIFIP